MSNTLKKKINSRRAKISIIGLGYVGLPIAVNFAKAGFKVFGLDLDQDRVRKVNASKSYILDVKSSELAKVVGSGKLVASTKFEILKEVDAIIICVPTPLRRKYTPDVKYIMSAVRSISQYLKKDTLVIMESTTYPGTTEELIYPEFRKKGFKLDKDLFLSFSPERIDPGNKKYDVTKITKVVGGLSEKSGELTKLLYQKIIKNIHVVSGAKAAEMTKLLENSFRIINIGWINEVAMMCHKMGINVWEVIEAAKTKPFGFMPFSPGLGVGGHCIPDDPLYLYWKAKHHGFSSKYIKLSADINLGMIDYAIGRLTDILKDKKKTLTQAKLLIVGATYKKDVHDLRKSPPLEFMERLQDKPVKTLDYYDPIIPYLEIGKIHGKNSIKLNKGSLRKYDCVIITCDHSRVNYNLIRQNARLIFDIKNVYHGVKDKKIIRY